MLGKLKSLTKLAVSLGDRQKAGAMLRALVSYERSLPADCPICGYSGKFQSAGVGVRERAACAKCGSLERHRLFALANLDFAGKTVLHFAPEGMLRDLIRAQKPAAYETADLSGKGVDRVLNIEAIDQPSESLDVVVSSHVLEHVDDRKALAELFRVLKPGGQLIAMVPIVEGWEATFEDDTIRDEAGREAAFGQDDHVRFYGADFRDRIRDAGFDLTEHTAWGMDAFRYALMRGEKVFIATRPVAAGGQ